MNDDFFMKLCDVYGFAPSRALRELVDAAIGQAVVAERHACARIVENEAMTYSEPTWAVEIVNDIRARGQP